eukprot:2918421-Rhodomonas_salina.1
MAFVKLSRIFTTEDRTGGISTRYLHGYPGSFALDFISITITLSSGGGLYRAIRYTPGGGVISGERF